MAAINMITHTREMKVFLLLWSFESQMYLQTKVISVFQVFYTVFTTNVLELKT